MRCYKAALLLIVIAASLLACGQIPIASPSEPAQTEAVQPDSGHPAGPTRTLPEPLLPPESPPAPTGLNVPLQVFNPLDVARVNEPITSGLPLPRDLDLANADRLRLVDVAGNPVPAQFTPLARWGAAPDHVGAPIRWVLVDFQATVEAQGTAYYFLQEGGPGPSPALPLTVVDSAEAVTIDTGVARFSISKVDGSFSGPGLSGVLIGRVQSGSATYTTAGPVTVSVALQGPMRVSVHVQGAYRAADGKPLLDYTSRYWFYAAQSAVRLFHTVENNALCPLIEFGQINCYDIGSGGSVAFADLSLIAPASVGAGPTFVAGGAGEPVHGDLAAEVVLYQDSSGTDHWDTYSGKTDWDGNPLDTSPRMQTYVAFRGYTLASGEEIISSGDQAAGWLSIAGSDGTWAVGVRDFWQNFPKALRAYPDGTLEIGLFPDEFGPADYAFTLRAGEHKTHEMILGSGWGEPMLQPLFAAPPPEWMVDSGALGRIALPDWVNWPEHEQYLADQLDTASEHVGWEHLHNNIFDAIERTDFYGIFDYGDWPIDYEGLWVAPLNTKYDSNMGLWLQWARGSDRRWFALAEAANRHLADIDILHNLHTPRHWGDGIAFGHSWHDEDGFTNPHRNGGGNHPDVAFGTAGLLLTYYLTGYEKAYDSALELADCIEYRLHNDAKLCSYFPDCNGEGYGLGESEGVWDKGERPAANSLYIAVSAYRATGDPRYLAVADALVDWARPDRQPYINGPTGEEHMVHPWTLNLYLRALADYLDMRSEFGLPDTTRARDSYLAYIDWLVTYAWLDLEPVDSGPRAAYPFEWWFDERQGDLNDEWAVGNNIPSINNWLLLGADTLAYAYHLSGDDDYLKRAEALFRTGSRDPWFLDDPSIYSESKQMVNSITFGQIFLHEWANAHR